MATVNFSPIFNGWQGFNAQGQPLNAGLIYTYQAGTSTPLATYTTSAGSVANTNPIVLGADGRPPQEIWLVQGSAYKFALYDSIGNLLWTYDNIYGVNDITSTTLATQIQNSSLVYAADTGTVNAYVITLSPAPAAYTSGMTVGFKTANANTITNPTLNVNTLGAITITGENGNAIGVGQIQTNAINWVTYNATGPRFELKSAASIGFIQSGTGAVARTVQDKERDVVSVKDFAVDITGATDSSAAIAQACAALGSSGGSVIVPWGVKLLIDTNLTIPANVYLVGPHQFVGTPGSNASAPYGNLGGALIINQAATITLQSGAGLNGLLIYRKGMTFPASDASGYAGTAVTAGGDDVSLSNLMGIGFNQLFTSTNYQRGFFSHVYGDNVNGILVSNSGDSPRFMNCHMWPFGTIAAAGAATRNQRAGVAYKFTAQASGLQMVNCFALGYLYGLSLNTVVSPIIEGFWCDMTGTYATSRGINIETNVTKGRFVGCKVWSTEQGYVQVANAGEVNSFIGCDVHSVTSNGFNIASGDAVIIGAHLTDIGGNGFNFGASSKVMIDDAYATSVTGAVINNGATDTSKIMLGRVYTDKAAGTAIIGSLTLPQIASADPLPILSYGDVFDVTGTTNFGGLSAGWAGRQVTLRFAGILTVTNSATAGTGMRLSGSVNFTSAAGSTLTLKHNGVQWYEIGRST